MYKNFNGKMERRISKFEDKNLKEKLKKKPNDKNSYFKD